MSPARRGAVGVVALAVVALAVATPTRAPRAQPSKLACVEANEQAQWLRRAGRFLAARARLELCVAQSCPGPVREDCAERLGEVNAGIPSVVLDVKDASGGDISTARVTLDGQPFAARIDGRAVELDPGEHTLVFEADGFPAVERKLVILERERARRVSVVVTAPPPSVRAAATAPRADAPGGLTQRRGALVVLGTGVASIADDEEPFFTVVVMVVVIVFVAPLPEGPGFELPQASRLATAGPPRVRPAMAIRKRACWSVVDSRSQPPLT